MNRVAREIIINGKKVLNNHGCVSIESIYSPTHPYTHVCARVYVRTHTHIHTRTHTHMHTRTQTSYYLNKMYTSPNVLLAHMYS